MNDIAIRYRYKKNKKRIKIFHYLILLLRSALLEFLELTIKKKLILIFIVCPQDPPIRHYQGAHRNYFWCCRPRVKPSNSKSFHLENIVYWLLEPLTTSETAQPTG